MDIIRKIRENYAAYNAPRRRIADFILNDPLKCSFLSLKDFSASASASEVTILSFCRDLGLSSFIDLKRTLKEYIFENNSPAERFRGYISVTDGNSEKLYDNVRKSLKDAIEETSRNNGYEKYSRGLELMRKAEKIFIAAHDASRIAGEYLRLRFSQLGCDIVLLDSESVVQNIALLNAADPARTLLISIATPPYGKSTIAMTELCSSIGIPVICLTDSGTSPLVYYSDVSFICVTAENFMGLTNSYSSFFGVIEILNILYYNGEDSQEKDDSFHALTEKYYLLLKA